MSQAPPRKSRAPLWVALASSALLAALGVVAFVEGTVADSSPRDPSSAADGVVCQLYQDGERRTPVRCAMIVEAPPAAVFDVVRDYEHFAETFDSALGAIELTSIDRRQGDTVHLVGRVHSPVFGEWPIDVSVVHEEREDGSRIARWEQNEGGALNRGRWMVTPVPAGTLLVYELEVESPWAPRFLVNDVLLTQQAYPLHHVADRASGGG